MNTGKKPPGGEAKRAEQPHQVNPAPPVKEHHEISADLPPGVKRAYLVTEAKPEAVVVYCSDPRFQRAISQFIAEELQLSEGQYIPLVVAGGADALSSPFRLPKEFKFMRDRLKLYQERFASVKRIVLIGHEDCKYYESMKDRIMNFVGSKITGLVEQHKETLMLLKKEALNFILPNVSVEVYFVKFADQSHKEVLFEKIG